MCALQEINVSTDPAQMVSHTYPSTPLVLLLARDLKSKEDAAVEATFTYSVQWVYHNLRAIFMAFQG